MRRKFWFAAGAIAGGIAIGLLLKPHPSLGATNGVSAITVVKNRNLTSVAISAIVQGDDDSSAVLRIFQRWQGAANYDTGMVMVRRPHTGGEIFEGRILWMTPNRTAQFYIEAVDATSGTTTTAVDTVSCAQVPPIVATGPVYYVNQATGASGHGGLSPGDAMKTINQALTKLAASANQGGNGGIIIAPGEYHERLDLNFGTDGYPRFLTGDGTAPDSTIICGANEGVENGFDGDGSTALNWTLRPPDVNKADSVWATPFVAGDSTQLIVLGWSEYLHRKTSFLGLARDTISAKSCSSAPTGFEISGWYWKAGPPDTLFVKRRNGQTPAGLKLHAGYRDKLIEVLRRNWHISRLTFRFAGSLSNNGAAYPADPDPGENGFGILATSCSGSRSISGLTVDSCKFIGLNAAAISTNNVCVRSDSVVVAHCYFDGLSVGSWDYSASKCHGDESSSQPFLRNGSDCFVSNTITGCFNGFGSGAGQADSSGGQWCEIANNYFSHFPDDGIEIDDSDNINLLISGNTCFDTGSGVSIAPCYRGPQFIFYNNFMNTKARGIKGSFGNTAITKVYQNTFASTSGGPGGSPAYDDSPGGGAGINYEFLNNIFVAKKGSAVILGPGSGGSITQNTFNYDLIDSTASVTRLVQWNGVNYSFPTMKSTLGWEKNGVRAHAYFADSTNLDYRISKTSPAWKGGRRITGVNTSLDGLRYTTLPNMGSKNCICETQ